MTISTSANAMTGSFPHGASRRRPTTIDGAVVHKAQTRSPLKSAAGHAGAKGSAVNHSIAPNAAQPQDKILEAKPVAPSSQHHQTNQINQTHSYGADAYHSNRLDMSIIGSRIDTFA